LTNGPTLKRAGLAETGREKGIFVAFRCAVFSFTGSHVQIDCQMNTAWPVWYQGGFLRKAGLRPMFAADIQGHSL
jgi:hypothetical protein